MLHGKPLFSGDNFKEMVHSIFRVLGTPTLKEMDILNHRYKDNRFKKINRPPLKKVFSREFDHNVYDFLGRLLV